LDEIQALERLNSAALEQVDQSIFLLRRRMPYKKLDTILPYVLDFVSQMMFPLIDKIDTVHYTEQSRMLKVAEDYAVRLLQPKYSPSKAMRIAGDLVNKYPEHGFVIGIEEAGEMLDLPVVSPTQQAALDQLCSVLTFRTDIVLGRLVEVPDA
jgi:hypothetical protein